MFSKLLTAAIVATALTACGGGSSDQAIEDDYITVCNSAELSGANKIQDPNERVMHLADWLKKNVKTAEVKKFLKTLAGNGGGGAALKVAAADYGYTGPCPLADEK